MTNRPLNEFTEERVHQALRDVVAHLWQIQQQDCLSCFDQDQKHHLFESVDLIAQWLENLEELRKHRNRLTWLWGSFILLIAACFYCLPALG